MSATNETLSRVVRRRARPGHEQAYEAAVRDMLAASSRYPGYLSAAFIPPDGPAGDYQIIQRFASLQDLERWDASDECAHWHERLRPLAESEPEYRLLGGLDVWFAAPPKPGAPPPPPRWRMTVVSWLGIYPTVSLCLWFIAPRLATLPFLLRTALITAIVAIAMSYLVMPRLSRWMSWWLRK